MAEWHLAQLNVATAVARLDSPATVEEAPARLDHLRRHGPRPRAFTFKEHCPSPGNDGGPTDLRPEPYCVGWA